MSTKASTNECVPYIDQTETEEKSWNLDISYIDWIKIYKNISLSLHAFQMLRWFVLDQSSW